MDKLKHTIFSINLRNDTHVAHTAGRSSATEEHEVALLKVADAVNLDAFGKLWTWGAWERNIFLLVNVACKAWTVKLMRPHATHTIACADISFSYVYDVVTLAVAVVTEHVLIHVLKSIQTVNAREANVRSRSSVSSYNFCRINGCSSRVCRHGWDSRHDDRKNRIVHGSGLVDVFKINNGNDIVVACG